MIDANQAMLDLFDGTRDELQALLTDRRYIVADDRMRLLAALAAGGAARDLELRLRRVDGTELLAELSVSLRFDQDGRPIGAQGVIRDVTAVKATQAQLEQQAYHFARPLPGELFERAPIAGRVAAA